MTTLFNENTNNTSEAIAINLVFIDSGVEDYQYLLQGVIPSVQAHIINSASDGIEQISQILQQHQNIDEVHIISHGSPGCLYLGNSQLSLDNLNSYTSQLQQWNIKSLLLYGCHVAAGDAGAEFIEKLHNLTGAEIAASKSLTGSTIKGGNWQLEYQTGEEKYSLVLLEVTVNNYSGILAASMVKDIYPGSGSSDLYQLTNVNGTLYFTANDGINGRELWKSDGTANGTVLVKDIRPGGGSSDPYQLTNINGTLYFVADNGINGKELWKSDGTANGTVLVKDISPSNNIYDTSGIIIYPSGFNPNPDNLTNVNGTLYFTVDDNINGIELWKSDGTINGTVPVKDIRPGNDSSSPYKLININGILYFTANDGTNGDELWKSDGTANGTVLVKDIRPGNDSSSPFNLTNVNATLYFTAYDMNGVKLWKSDGTANGTFMIKDISPFNLTNVNGTLYFTANDGTNDYDLWKSDGNANGTVLVKDIWSGSVNSSPFNLTNINDNLYFMTFDYDNGYGLWKSDGTANGTVLVKDIYPGSMGTTLPSLSNLTNVNNTLYFVADESVGGELWKSDGTTNGTIQVQDINPVNGIYSPNNLTNVNDTLYFTADDGINGNELWKLEANTTPNSPINVTTTVDENNGTGNISLREAVIQANGSVGDDTILLEADQTYNLTILNITSDNVNYTEDLSATGDLDILASGKVTILVQGDGKSTINAGGIDRVLDVRDNASLELKNIVVTGGNRGYKNQGGGIYSKGILTISDSTITGNTGVWDGGGILSDGGILNIINSTISNNHTIYWGGGINVRNGQLSLKNSTISNNTARDYSGGGISTSGTTNITNSTISGNNAGANGGGIYIWQQTTNITNITNTTITSNTSHQGSGIFSLSTTHLDSSIVAGNHQNNDISASQEPKVVSGSHNLIGNATGFETVFNTVGDQIGTAITPLDAKLGPLQDNGGATFTHALLAGSPAINSGDTYLAEIQDQRRYSRNELPDIGAYEYWEIIPSDTIAPLASSFTPADNAIAVEKNANLIIKFNETVQQGTGDILLKQTSDNSIIPANMTVNEDQLTIAPTNDLAENTSYYVEIADSAIKDSAGNYYAGITGNSVWNFQTVEGTTVGATTGSDLLIGTAGPDTIDGLAGNDSISGLGGNDRLIGSDGDDSMNGGVGDDTMIGGSGNDTYIVNSPRDRIVETLNAGKDSVLSTATYKLPANVENITLRGTRAINGTGNSLPNQITGNGVANKLNGGTGDDTIIGLAGNDSIIGGAGIDSLNGSGGKDTLVGNAGNDTLIGGTGADRFVYNTNKVFVNSAIGVDTITDFTKGQLDKIVLDKTTFTRIGSIAGNGFSVISEFASLTSNWDRSGADIVYDRGTGKLFYNQNGTAAGYGTGGHFITLSNKPALSASDFMIQA